MTELRNMLEDTVDRLFRDLMKSGIQEDESGGWALDMWGQVEEMGIPNLFLAESDGGFDGNWEDAYVVLNRMGYYSLPLPIAETMLSYKLFAGIKLPVTGRPVSFSHKANAKMTSDNSGQLRFSGEVFNVPWGGAVSHIVVACDYDDDNHLVLLSVSDTSEIRTGHNIANEPRDTLCFSDTPVIAHTINSSPIDMFCYGALLRVSQIAGALDSSLRRSIEFANERSQFGRPIARFQAIQHQLALLANEVAAVSCAAMAACRSADIGDAVFEIAAAKLRANRAIGKATSIAHQVHGAIGFTEEHSLHRVTQRLMAWRSEYGNDRYWAKYLGNYVVNNNADCLWTELTNRSEREYIQRQ